MVMNLIKIVLLLLLSMIISVLFIYKANASLYLLFMCSPALMSFIVWFIQRKMTMPPILKHLDALQKTLIMTSFSFLFGWMTSRWVVQFLFAITGSLLYSLSIVKMVFFMKGDAQ